MKVGLPRLQDLSDIRKYLLIIETLELERLNNVMVHPTSLPEQAVTHEDLKSIKKYHKEMTDFLITKQNEHRMNEFELSFVTEMQNFLEFWTRIIENFKQVSRTEIEATIDKNESIKEEFNELMEKYLGFRPPANPTFLNLQAIRKVVARLRLNDPIQFINFDFFKKYNIKLNEDWVRDRKLSIIKKMEHLEKRLTEVLRTLRDRLALELQKLHVKRLRQYDILMVKHMKIKNSISELNAKEKFELKKMQTFLANRVGVTTLFHKNEMFLKGMIGRPTEVLWDPFVDTQKTAPLKSVMAQSVFQPKSQTPGKSYMNTLDTLDRSVGRIGKSKRMTSAVINFGPKNNDFGSEMFLGEIDVAQVAKDRRKKTVKF